jgi:hypothetical protein
MIDEPLEERRLTAFLADSAPPEAPAGLRTGIRDIARSNRQRRPWIALVKERPMRLSNRVAVGSPTARLAVVPLLLVLLLATAGAAVVGAQTLSPYPSATPTPLATPMLLPNLHGFTPPLVPNLRAVTPTALPAGTYSYPENAWPDDAQLAVFTLPAGWSTFRENVTKNYGTPQEVLFTFWVVTEIFRDACHWDTYEGGLVSAGSTPDDLVNALSQQLGRTASTPTDVTVGGYPAKMIELTVPADLDPSTCSHGSLRFWPSPVDPNSGLFGSPAGSIDDVYAIDLNGHRDVMLARHYPGSSDADKAELQAIVDSVQFVPWTLPAESPSSSASFEASGAPSPRPSD